MKRKKGEPSLFDLLTEYKDGKNNAVILRKIILKAGELLAAVPDLPPDKSWISCKTALEYLSIPDPDDMVSDTFLKHCGYCEFCGQHQQELIDFNYRLKPKEMGELIITIFKP